MSSGIMVPNLVPVRMPVTLTTWIDDLLTTQTGTDYQL